jgi:hypothetical protein
MKAKCAKPGCKSRTKFQYCTHHSPRQLNSSLTGYQREPTSRPCRACGGQMRNDSYDTCGACYFAKRYGGGQKPQDGAR